MSTLGFGLEGVSAFVIGSKDLLENTGNTRVGKMNGEVAVSLNTQPSQSI